MNTRLPWSRRLRGLALLSAGLFAVAAIRAEIRPLLDYRFDNGTGGTITDHGPAGLHLGIGAAMGWGLPGSGVAGGVSVGRVADGDVLLDNKDVRAKGLDGLRAFTVCGWYKANFIEPTHGVLFEITPIEGVGYRLHLVSRREPDGSLRYALVSSVIPPAGGAEDARRVIFSPWENRFATEGEWMFFAVTVDLRDDARLTVFYSGTETEAPRMVLGPFKRPASWAHIEALGRVRSVRMGNSLDAKQPVPIGFYFDDLSFYGSRLESGGALDAAEIGIVWENTKKKAHTP